MCPHFHQRKQEEIQLSVFPLVHYTMWNIAPLHHMPQQISWQTVSMTVVVNSMRASHKQQSPFDTTETSCKNVGCSPGCECRYCKFCFTVVSFFTSFYKHFCFSLWHTSLADLLLSFNVVLCTTQEKIESLFIWTLLWTIQGGLWQCCGRDR